MAESEEVTEIPAVEKNLERLARVTAEFDNYSNRTEKEKKELMEFGVRDLVLSLLPVLEEMHLACEEARRSPNDSLGKGVAMVFEKLEGVLRQEGLEEMQCVGVKFDSILHDAVASEESAFPEGTVIKVLNKGYFLKGKILKNAVVIVSKGIKGEGEVK